MHVAAQTATSIHAAVVIRRILWVDSDKFIINTASSPCGISASSSHKDSKSSCNSPTVDRCLTPRVFIPIPPYSPNVPQPTAPAGPASGSGRLLCVAEERTGDRVRAGDCLRRSRVRARPRSAGAPQGSPKGPRSTGAQAPALARRARTTKATPNPPGHPETRRVVYSSTFDHSTPPSPCQPPPPSQRPRLPR